MLRAFILALFCSAAAFAADKPIDPALFDLDRSGALDEAELKSYLVRRDKLKPDLERLLNADLSFKAKVTTKQEIEELFRKDVEEQALDQLGELKAHLLPARPPFPIELIRRYSNRDDAKNDSAESQNVIPGFFREAKKTDSSSRGPLLLRRSPDEWSEAVTDADGMRLAHAEDNLKSRDSWSAEGAVIYPLTFSRDHTASAPGRRVRSDAWRILPSVNWRVVRVAEDTSADIEELQFNLPFIWSANLISTGALRNLELSAAPYVLTDFRFGGLMSGASVKILPYLLTDSTHLAINTGYKGLGSGPLLYQLGLVPTLDFSHLHKGSRFIASEADDNFFRIGGKASLGLRTRNFPSLELKGSYQWFNRLSGGPSHSDLLSLAARLWLNANVATTFEHQEGDTPIARKSIDLTTLGLEVRY